MALPIIEFSGRLTADPELKFTPSGSAVVNFSVACNDNKKDDSGTWVKGETTFLELEAWGAFAENIVSQLNKGDRVGGKAQWRERSYEAKDGSGKRKAYSGRVRNLWQEISQYAPDGVTPQPQSNSATFQGAPDPWNSPLPVGGVEEEAPF